ncbi:MAG: hypothetical protein ACI8RD_003785 [Bacillariaceae sp.]
MAFIIVAIFIITIHPGLQEYAFLSAQKDASIEVVGNAISAAITNMSIWIVTVVDITMYLSSKNSY